jgi:hypothetical protein
MSNAATTKSLNVNLRHDVEVLIREALISGEIATQGGAWHVAAIYALDGNLDYMRSVMLHLQDQIAQRDDSWADWVDRVSIKFWPAVYA